eukprot:7458387-Pyramimonas_sp.AAC.1
MEAREDRRRSTGTATEMVSTVGEVPRSSRQPGCSYLWPQCDGAVEGCYAILARGLGGNLLHTYGTTASARPRFASRDGRKHASMVRAPYVRSGHTYTRNRGVAAVAMRRHEHIAQHSAEGRRQRRGRGRD